MTNPSSATGLPANLDGSEYQRPGHGEGAAEPVSLQVEQQLQGAVIQAGLPPRADGLAQDGTGLVRPPAAVQRDAQRGPQLDLVGVAQGQRRTTTTWPRAWC